MHVNINELITTIYNTSYLSVLCLEFILRFSTVCSEFNLNSNCFSEFYALVFSSPLFLTKLIIIISFDYFLQLYIHCVVFSFYQVL